MLVQEFILNRCTQLGIDPIIKYTKTLSHHIEQGTENAVVNSVHSCLFCSTADRNDK